MAKPLASTKEHQRSGRRHGRHDRATSPKCVPTRAPRAASPGHQAVNMYRATCQHGASSSEHPKWPTCTERRGRHDPATCPTTGQRALSTTMWMTGIGPRSMELTSSKAEAVDDSSRHAPRRCGRRATLYRVKDRVSWGRRVPRTTKPCTTSVVTRSPGADQQRRTNQEPRGLVRLASDDDVDDAIVPRQPGRRAPGALQEIFRATGNTS